MMETMEWAKQSEEMLKTWTETQKKMWDDWMKAMQGLGTSPSTEVWEKTVDSWNQTIQRLLDAQVEGARHWVENLTTAKGTPEETAEWAKRGQDIITRWTETQKQLWGSWFEVIKKLDASNMMNWTRDGQKFIQSWQETIQKALDSQAEWLRTTGQPRKKS
jgi:hypothetical protein